jgi:hypothetical protein
MGWSCSIRPACIRCRVRIKPAARLLIEWSNMLDAPPTEALPTRSSIFQNRGSRSKSLDPKGPICLAGSVIGRVLRPFVTGFHSKR